MKDLNKSEVSEEKKERDPLDKFAITFFKWFGGLLILSLFLNVVKSPEQRERDAKRIEADIARKQLAEVQRAQHVRLAQELWGSEEQDLDGQQRVAESIEEDMRWESVRR